VQDDVTANQLIATAIIIKNIPYSYPEGDFVTKLFPLLRLNFLYAFNYHRNKKDNSFHGLAFANFKSSTDAQAAIEALNNYELKGRILQVELKKRLPVEENMKKELARQAKNQQSSQMFRDILNPLLRPVVVFLEPSTTPTVQNGTPVSRLS